MTRGRRLGLAAAIVAGAFSLYEIVTSYLAYTADAHVRSDLVAVAPQVTGRIIAVHVTDNQQAATGDPLVTIDPEPFQLAVDQRRAELDEATAQINADAFAVATAQDNLTSATSAASYAQENQTRLSTLVRSQDASQADLDQANDALKRALAARDAAREAVSAAQAASALHRAAQARATAALATASACSAAFP